VPAARLALASENRSNRVAGTLARSLTLLATVVLAAIAAVIILRLSGSWTGGDLHRFHHQPSADMLR